MLFYVSCSPDIQRIVLAVIELKHKAIRIYNDFLLIFNSAVLTVCYIFTVYMNDIFTTFWYISKHVCTVKYDQILSRERSLSSMYLSTIKAQMIAV